MAEYEERTEQATPRKRQKAREKGQIARSRDLSSIAAMGGIILVILVGGGHFMHSLENVTADLLGLRYGRDPFKVLRGASVDTMLLLLPFLGVAMAFGVGANLFQGGIILKPFELEADKINPLSGIKRIFSVNGLTEFLKSMAKFFLVGYLFYFVNRKNLGVLPYLMGMDVPALARTAGALVMKATYYGFSFFLVFGVVDYFIERFRFERSIRMSREELKEENKETEGNPMIKSRIRGLQREMARRRMMQEVPKATVVITNPTHLAVALRYEDKKMSAPRIIAKGADVLAERIKEIARKHEIPIVEDRPLARVLYKLDIDAYIPEELYKAVAKILAYIYKLKGAVA